MTRCQGALCGIQAEVSVDRLGSPPINVCWGHLRQMLTEQQCVIGGFHRIGWQPQSCRNRCSRVEDATMIEVDEALHPLCQRHLDDMG